MYEVFKFFPRTHIKYSPGFVCLFIEILLHTRFYFILFLILMNYEYFR